MWCIPAQSNAHFVCQMESVLQVYTRPQDPLWPVVCMDETSVQCVKEVRLPIAAKPGQSERYDVEYERTPLVGLIKRGREAAYRRRHAEVLLLVDQGKHGPAQN